MNQILYAFVMLPIFTGLILYILDRFLSRTIAIAMQVALFVLSLFLARATSIAPIIQVLTPVSIPTGMVLYADSLSSTLLILSNFLFCTLVIFSYKKPYMNRLFLFLFLSLQGLINGLFLSSDLFNMYILIEVSTITVSILIMFKKDSQSMYDGMIYLISNMAAMAFFLFGVAFIYKTFGILDLQSLATALQSVTDKKILFLPFAFLLTGVALKSAILPLFSWLPKAHGTASAPSVVSAILSGIFVKVGLYMLIRMQQLFAPIINIQDILLILGFLTAIFGFIFAMSQTDIKLILAYHTVSQAGLIIIGISGHLQNNYYGGLYHILSHGVFKSLLFLVSGILTHYYKTRKIKKMTGLWSHSKFLSIVLLVAVLSISGAPFFSGGFSKYYISYGYEGWIYTLLFTIISMGTMISFVKFIVVIFSKPEENAEPLHIDKNERLTLAIFAITCIFLGSSGNFIGNFILSHPFKLSLLGLIQKLPTYLILYALSYLLYENILKDHFILARIKKIELTFNAINIAIVSFFFLTLTYFANM